MFLGPLCQDRGKLGVVLPPFGSPCKYQMGQGAKKDAAPSLPSGKLHIFSLRLDKGPLEGGRLGLAASTDEI